MPCSAAGPVSAPAHAALILGVLTLFVWGAPAAAQGDDLLFSDKPGPAAKGGAAPAGSVKDGTARPKPAQARPKASPGAADDEARMDEVKALSERSTGEAYCARALAVYRDAAARGNARAQYNLGVFSRYGQCVPKDPALAADWYRKAADGGDSTARASLGLLYCDGLGVPRDEPRGLRLIEQAAARGEPVALYSLGQFAQFGLHGVAKDPSQAIAYLEQAIASGSVRAYYNLSIIYRHGQGAPTDQRRALTLSREGAALGDADCQVDLGWHYFNAKGTAPDPAQAYFWTLLGLANPDLGDESRKIAQDNLKVYQTALSPGQINDIEARARRFDPRKPGFAWP